jgi:protein gp37
MGANSKIEWTHHTFNPWRGCTKVSAGCANCYAETLSHRNPSVLGIWGDHGTRVIAAADYWRQPIAWNKEAAAAGERRRVFCASLADVFEDRPELLAPREKLFNLIDDTPHLDWLLLTKRPENIRRLWVGRPYRENVWRGTSVEDQTNADKRIPELLLTHKLSPIAFLSMEPLLGAVDLDNIPRPNRPGSTFDALREATLDGRWSPHVQWVIVGGESGHGARPMHPDWVRSIQGRCAKAGVPFFFKQWGEWEPVTPLYEGRDDAAENGRGDLEQLDTSGRICGDRDGQPNDLRTWLIERVGKKAAGRLLDGREWSEFPLPMGARR